MQKIVGGVGRTIAAALILASALIPASAQGQWKRFSVDRWTDREGLPNNSLSSVVQSSDGYLWIGSLAGAARFDGVRFTPILEGLPNAHIRTLLADRKGNVWVSLVGAGLARYKDGHVEFFDQTRLTGSEVRVLSEDEDGQIWAGTDNGISIIGKGQIVTLRKEQGLPGNEVIGLAAGHGRMWISTDNGICEARGTKIRCGSGQTLRGALQDTVAREGVLLEDRDGRLWIGGSKGLFSFRPDFTAAGECAQGCLSGHAVTSLRESRDGGLWAGFNDGGVASLKSGKVEYYGQAEGLSAGPVVSLFEDLEGSVWIGLYNGPLERLRPNRVRMYSTADGLPAKVAGSIVQDANGTIWAGTQCGPVSEFQDGRFVPRFAEYTKQACALSLWAARDGALWIGTDNGLFRWFGGEMRHFGKEEGLSDLNVRALFEDRNGTIWIGTLFGGLHTWSRGVLSRAYGLADGVAVGQIESFAQDHEGRVWIGSNGNGLSIAEKGKFRRATAAEAVPDPDVCGLFVDSRGDLWVATDRSGVFRRHNGKFDSFGLAQGLDRLVALMLEDRAGFLWISTARGIHRVRREQVDATAGGHSVSLEPVLIDRSDGMLNPEVSGGGFDPTGLVDRDGRLWFSTIDGIALIDPAKFRLNSVPPPVAIEGASIGGHEMAFSGGAINVPAGSPPLAVSYTALSFLAPHKVRFRYRMRGLETAWEEAGDRRTAYYPRLPAGNYAFEVLAANNDGVWSKVPASISVTAASYWWEGTGVRTAGLVLLLLATGLIVRKISIRRAAGRVAELERQQSLNRERDRIARDIHDDLGARLTRISLIADSRDPAMAGVLGGEAREAIQAMDELVWTVNTRNGSTDSFVSYAVSYAEKFLRAAHVAVRVATPAEIPDAELQAEARRHLFLSFKEALNNVVKHSGATECRIEFEASEETLGIRVTDNGHGFSEANGNNGRSGLRGMRERMSSAGGACEIRTSAGSGTTVHIHVRVSPLKV